MAVYHAPFDELCMIYTRTVYAEMSILYTCFVYTDFSLTTQNNCTKFEPALQRTLLEGSVSQKFELGLSFYFMP